MGGRVTPGDNATTKKKSRIRQIEERNVCLVLSTKQIRVVVALWGPDWGVWIVQGGKLTRHDADLTYRKVRATKWKYAPAWLKRLQKMTGKSIPIVATQFSKALDSVPQWARTEMNRHVHTSYSYLPQILFVVGREGIREDYTAYQCVFYFTDKPTKEEFAAADMNLKNFILSRRGYGYLKESTYLDAGLLHLKGQLFWDRARDLGYRERSAEAWGRKKVRTAKSINLIYQVKHELKQVLLPILIIRYPFIQTEAEFKNLLPFWYRIGWVVKTNGTPSTKFRHKVAQGICTVLRNVSRESTGVDRYKILVDIETYARFMLNVGEVDYPHHQLGLSVASYTDVLRYIELMAILGESLYNQIYEIRSSMDRATKILVGNFTLLTAVSNAYWSRSSIGIYNPLTKEYTFGSHTQRATELEILSILLILSENPGLEMKLIKLIELYTEFNIRYIQLNTEYIQAEINQLGEIRDWVKESLKSLGLSDDGIQVEVKA